MKKVIICLSILMFMSCGKQKQSEDTVVELPAYISDIVSLKQEKDPIGTFKAYASEHSVYNESINKSNIKAVLNKVKEAKYNFILVGNHTLVKITELSNCKPSRAWAACMPKGEGYIKKGNLNYKNDYINNIIGLPDNQDRVLYSFN